MEDYTHPEYSVPSPAQLQERRTARTKARRERQRRRRRRRLAVAIPLLCLTAAAVLWTVARSRTAEAAPVHEAPRETPQDISISEPEPEPTPVFFSTEHTAYPGDELDSDYAVLIDADTGEVLAAKNSDAVINPASMTKILTILTAVGCIEDPDAAFTVTKEMSDYAYLRGLSIAGFLPGETVTIADLLYGTILPSGADAAMGLAVYAAGSQEDFVALMNEKAAALGVSDAAHFTNCSGAYGEEHHCTATDVALILKAAMEEPLCREVLSSRIYTTSGTEEHPEGLVLSNWFLRRIEDKDTGQITVLGAKTGYVNEAGSCAASCGVSKDGNLYICVTGSADSAWRCIYDHVYLYKDFCP